MPVPQPTPPRLRLYNQALDQARDLGDPNDASRWLIRHGLLSLTDHPSLPPTWRPPLAVATQRNAAANLLRVARYQTIAEALAGFPFAPLKGIHLLDTVYREDPENRVLTDLDLLIRERDTTAVLDRLDSLGYRESAASRRVAAHRHERVLSDGTLTVELHTRLGITHGPRSGWEELAPKPGGQVHGRPCYLLDAETSLVHLVTHFVRHGPFTRLAWVEDVVRWTEPAAGGVDAERSVDVARRLGAERSFTAGVRAIAALVGEEFLAAVPRRDDDRLLRLHERLVWSHLATRPLLCGFASNSVRRNLSAALLTDRPGDTAGFMVSKGMELKGRWLAGK